MSKLSFCIIIPVYNEEEIILKVISKALNFIKNTNSKILIINDGSKDNTRKKLDKIKSKKILIFHKKNEGHGKTLIFGYKKAINMKAEYVLQIDSDDQIAFNEFKKLIKYKKKYDFIIGNRQNRDDPFSRILISGFMKLIIFLKYGKYIVDPNCPLRIIKTSLKQIINKISFSIVPNILIAISSKKMNSYKSVNVKHIKRYTGSSIKFFLNYIKHVILAFFDIFKFKLL